MGRELYDLIQFFQYDVPITMCTSSGRILDFGNRDMIPDSMLSMRVDDAWVSGNTLIINVEEK